MARYIHASLIGFVVICALTSADWPRFRGPGGLGISEDGDLPVKWSENNGIAWKIELPGSGSSSPIVSGGRVFVTCFSGYGVDGRNGGADQLRRLLLCADLESGEILWTASDKSRHDVTRAGGFGVREHGYASSTPVTDGERVYAFFGTTGVVAYDVSGKEIWRAEVGGDPATDRFGSASSPILYKDLLIVPATVESEAIIAFDTSTGKEKWKAPATGYGGAWTTPILVDTGKRQELVVSLPDEVWGLNPENGKLRWYAESSISGGAVCPSTVAENGVIYAIGGRAGRAIAVRAGGRGDVTKSHVAWSASTGSYVPSPVAYRGHLYWANDRGIVYCLDAKTGAIVFRERLEDAGGVYASIHAAGDRLYVVSRRRGTFVLAAKPEFKLLAHNELAAGNSDFSASPAASAGRLLLRSSRFLYCIGGQSTESSGEN